MKKEWRVLTQEEKQLVKDNLTLVSKMSIAMSKSIAAIPLDDISSLGMFGLIDAAQKYDYMKGGDFSLYASSRIRGTILDGLRDEDFLSRRRRKEKRSIEETIQKMVATLGRHVSVEEVAEKLGIELENLEEIFTHISSLNYPLDSQNDYFIEDFVSDRSYQRIENKVCRKELRKILLEAMSRYLDSKTREIVILRIWGDYTCLQIGALIGMAESSVSTRWNKAISILRNKLWPMKNELLSSL